MSTAVTATLPSAGNGGNVGLGSHGVPEGPADAPLGDEPDLLPAPGLPEPKPDLDPPPLVPDMPQRPVD